MSSVARRHSGKSHQEGLLENRWRSFSVCLVCAMDKDGVFTKMSRIPDKYLSDLLAQMARQCKLTKSDFLALVDCPLSREAYEEKLREQHCL